MTDTLLMLSGGIDSAYCLWQRVQQRVPTRTHHVHLADAEGRADVEARAVTRVLEWMEQNGGRGLIHHTESAVDFTDLWVPLNHHLWAYWVGAILAAPDGRDYQHVIVPRHSDAFHDGDVDGPAAQASDAAYLGHIRLMAPHRVPTLTYPIRHLTKAEIVAAMPPDLLACCWWCRRPDPGPTPCGTCYTCRLVDPALPAGFHPHYLNEWTETPMASKSQRLEIRLADRIVYSRDVAEVELNHRDGRLMVNACEPGMELTAETAALPDNPLLPPTPLPGAPDGHDEETDPADPVLERVHTGEEYTPAVSRPRRGGKNAGAKAKGYGVVSEGVTPNQIAAEGQADAGPDAGPDAGHETTPPSAADRVDNGDDE